MRTTHRSDAVNAERSVLSKTLLSHQSKRQSLSLITFTLNLFEMRNGENKDRNTQTQTKHRSDSIQGTDYITNYFLNLRVSRTKIENLK